MYTSDGNIIKMVITRIVLVMLTTTLIVLALPRSSSPMLNIVEGRPWTQSTVIAPYEMPILKPQSVLDAERDSVIRLLSPYYNLDTSVSREQTKRFVGRFSNGINGLPKSFLNTVTRKLSEIYEVGIINKDEFSKLSKDTLATIQMVTGKTTRKKLVRNLLTPVSAYEYFFTDPQMAAFRQQLQQCNLNDYFVLNLTYDKQKSESAQDEQLKSLSKNTGLIMKGEKIIDRGEIVDHTAALKLQSYVGALSKNDSDASMRVTLIGQIIFVLLVVVLFTVYLHLFRGDYFLTPRSISMAYILITAFPVIVALMMRNGFNPDYIYVLPYAMAPIFIRVFLDSRTAVMVHFVVIFLCSLAVADQYTFVITQVLSGIVAIYSLRELSSRLQIIIAALFVFVTNVTVLYVCHLMLPGDDTTIDMMAVKFMFFSGIFILLIYPLMFLVEKTFGFTSAVTLIELSDTNKDLLRNLSEVAPGTFQHSITVGNLAAAIATRIKAKSLLVRTGALYHDIGKMTNPVFFTENQAGVSPHDRMTPVESAQVIINHVSEGIRLADRYGLPEVIRNFILTHHGAGMAKYFYITYKNDHPDEEVDTTYFSYPGPNPFTREQAILMMADSVEAASRSLNEYTEENITNLVNRIIDAQVADGFFRECPITFRDIATAKQVLIEKLKSLYHTRISYPELKK